eukprot:3941156-Rhodomonas_salina.7
MRATCPACLRACCSPRLSSALQCLSSALQCLSMPLALRALLLHRHAISVVVRVYHPSHGARRCQEARQRPYQWYNVDMQFRSASMCARRLEQCLALTAARTAQTSDARRLGRPEESDGQAAGDSDERVWARSRCQSGAVSVQLMCQTQRAVRAIEQLWMEDTTLYSLHVATAPRCRPAVSVAGFRCFSPEVSELCAQDCDRKAAGKSSACCLRASYAICLRARDAMRSTGIASGAICLRRRYAPTRVLCGARY